MAEWMQMEGKLHSMSSLLSSLARSTLFTKMTICGGQGVRLSSGTRPASSATTISFGLETAAHVLVSSLLVRCMTSCDVQCDTGSCRARGGWLQGGDRRTWLKSSASSRSFSFRFFSSSCRQQEADAQPPADPAQLFC
jgi:hypothetical protein